MARAPITKKNPYYSKKYRRTFRTEREYRNFLAKRNGHSSWDVQRRSRRTVRNRAERDRLSASERAARKDALDVLSLMRTEGLTFTDAAKRVGVSPNAVLRHVGSALEKKNGRWRAKRSDRLYRIMPVLGPDGYVDVEPRDSREASLIGKHNSAIGHDLFTGDDSRLRKFDGESVQGVSFETDLDTIDDWANRGVLAEVEIGSDQPL